MTDGGPDTGGTAAAGTNAERTDPGGVDPGGADPGGADLDDAERIVIGDLGDLADGQMRCFEQIGEDGIVVCRAGGRLYALDDNCSHADTPLSEGRLRGFDVTCPLHGASFDVRDGSHSGPPAWEGVASHDVVEAGPDTVVVLRRDDRSGGSDGGGRLRTR